MNPAFCSTDIDATPEFSLATIETLTPAIVFVPGGVEKIISKLEADVRAIDRDISTEAGREAVKSLAYKVARSKTALDEMGKELVAGIKKQAGTIDAERRTIRDRLDALKEEVRRDLTAWEDAEAERVETAERGIVWLINAPRLDGQTAERIKNRIQTVRDVLADDDWQEFRERAAAAAAEAIATLETMLAAAEQAERDAAELAELRRMKAEREEQDRENARIEAAEVDAQQRAEQEAARKIDLDRIEAARTEQYQAMRLEAQAQAARDATAAAAKAVEDERKRVAAAQAAEEAAERKRQANAKHRAKIHKEIAAGFVKAGFECGTADILVSIITGGSVPHVSITY